MPLVNRLLRDSALGAVAHGASRTHGPRWTVPRPRRQRRDDARRGRHPRRGRWRSRAPVPQGIDVVCRGRARRRRVAAPGRRRRARTCRECGGCQLQHVDYAHQVELKRDIVLDALRRQRIAHPAPRMHGMSTIPGATAGAVSSTSSPASEATPPALGFNRARSWRPIAVDDCLIHHPRITTALPALRELVRRERDRCAQHAPPHRRRGRRRSSWCDAKPASGAGDRRARRRPRSPRRRSGQHDVDDAALARA